jgi:ubiquinol-cytochrome c reductase iron-sulfur subunit
MSRAFYTSVMAIALATAVAPPAHADDYPQGLVREQMELAARGPEADLGALKPGELLALEYVGRPVFVYRRTATQRAYLKKPLGAALADPQGSGMEASIDAAYASSASLVWARLLLVDQPALEKTPGRSREDEYLVIGGWSPHTGCKLALVAQSERAAPAVFTDSCGKGGEFDAAGRALKSKAKSESPARAAYNLYIPPHRFITTDRVAIGLAPGTQPPALEFSRANLYRGSDPTHDLIIAARYDDARMVDIALAKGADINAFRSEDGSPIDAAIIGSRIETVKMLLERGARPTGRSMRAAEFIGRKEVWELLEAMARKERSR